MKNLFFALVVIGLLIISILSRIMVLPEGFVSKENNIEIETMEEADHSMVVTRVEYVDEDDGRGNKGPYVNSSVEIWNPQIVDDFLAFQMRQNPDRLFDMDIIQQQATEEEARELLKNGKWPWSKRTLEIYQDVLSRNQYIKRSGLKAAEVDQTIYNEQAILRILGFHEKEGRFLLYGKEIPNLKAAEENVGQGTYGIQSGLVNKDIYKNNIKCKNGQLELTRFSGYNPGITGEAMFDTIPIHPETLPEIYKGFQYINEPCNPCDSLQFPYNNTCAFSIDPEKHVSPAWQKIWNLPETNIPKLPIDYTGWLG